MGVVTNLLAQMSQAPQPALDEVFKLVLFELRILARARLARERRSHSLRPTALVNELYLRLRGSPIHARDRQAFCALAGRVMGQILVDHARKRRAVKRGPGEVLELEQALEEREAPAASVVDLLDLERAFDLLRSSSERRAEIAARHLLAGYGFAEIAEALELSERTVYREWRLARAHLIRALSGAEEG